MTKTNVETLTGHQINALRNEAGQAGDNAMGAICDLASQGEIDVEEYHLSSRDADRIGKMSRDEAYAEIVRVINEHE